MIAGGDWNALPATDPAPSTKGIPAERAQRKLDRSAAQAIEEAAGTNLGGAAREFFEFVANAKKRGICPLKRGAEEMPT